MTSNFDEASLESSDRKARGIQSIVIGFEVLEKIVEAPGPLALKDLAAATGMAASKLRFYLVSFLDLGLVSQDPSNGRYSLGPAALKLGLAALEKVDVVRSSHGEMVALSDALGYTTFLAVWGTHGPTIVDRVDGRNRTVLEIRVGSVLPLLSSAIGLVYAAFLPRSATQSLLEREAENGVGAWAPTRPDFDLDAALQNIRASRFAVASGTLLAGFTAVASPVLDRSNVPVAAISVIGPIGRMDDMIDGHVVQALLELTTRLSRQIGWSDAAVGQ
ncbi:IclR family transcriptional regulator [Cupriavidus sp. 2TAF22]|uniref:IclR family transcriptional regulator n=1 Tax=unclassified Cupriavidus TaxID=2640874 RepID=UPI003F932C71